MSVWLAEHKTTSKEIGPGEPYWARLTLDTQVSLYLEAARGKGYPVQGVIYDVVRKPGLKPKQKETPLQYGERCLLEMSAHPDDYFRRGKVVRFETEATDALIDLASSTRNIRQARRENRWPKNPDACERYGRMCDYFDVCCGQSCIDDDARFQDYAGGTTISKSSLESWRRCPKEFYFAKVLGRRRKTNGGALRQGSTFHTGLEMWFRTLDLNASLEAMTEAKGAHELAKLKAMLVCYDARWRNEPWQVLSVEEDFEFPIVDPRTGKRLRGTRFNGRFDAVIKETEHAAASSSPSTHAA